jgi:hypothetical protein
MNKIPFMRKVSFFDRMFSCSYCTGFHAGWIAWALSRGIHGFEDKPSFLLGAVVWAFASSVFCYLIDTIAQFLEAKMTN